MTKGRLEAFSDGVIAILITIMVLELKVPHGGTLSSLRPLLPIFASYVASFTFLGIYWNNHHHMLHMTTKINGAILWGNLHLLFWLSLVPFVTAWMGENDFAAWPVALYGFDLFMSGIAYLILQTLIIRCEGPRSKLAVAIGSDWKGKASGLLYAIAIPSAFVHRWIAGGIYILVALMWLVPDPRIEKRLEKHESDRRA